MALLSVLLIGVGAGWVVWLCAALRMRMMPSRPEDWTRGRHIPNAVLAKLRLGERPDDGTVLNAAVFELADAGVLRIDPADSSRPAMVSPAVLPAAEQLPPYQSTVVARLLHRVGPSGRPVPLTALGGDEDEAARKWYRGFSRQVRQEAIRYGLLRSPASGGAAAVLFLVGFVLSGLTMAELIHYWHAAGLAPMALVLLLILITWGVAYVRHPRISAAGRAALADAPVPQAVFPATAAGQGGPNEIKVLPNQMQALPADQVWSDFGGSWHPLSINSKESYSAVGNAAPVAVLVFFALVSFGGLLFTSSLGTQTNSAAVVGFAVLPVLVVVGLIMNSLRRRHLPKRAVIQGQVAKLWKVTTNDGESSTTYYYCALDVGRAPESVKLKLRPGMYQRLRVGEQIEILVNPRRKHLRDIRSLGYAQ